MRQGSKKGLTKGDSKSKIQKILKQWICRGLPPDYNAFLFAAQIHYKGVKLTPEDSSIFRFYFVTRSL